MKFIQKNNYIKNIDFISFLLIITIFFYSLLVVWSATNQNIQIIKQKIIQIFIGIICMIFASNINPKIYKKLSFYFYIIYIILLLLVNFFGQNNKGSQRWLNFGFINFQPSEIGKIIIPLTIASVMNQNCKFFILKNIIFSLILIFIPIFLIIKQPDLGTAILILLSGSFILFLSEINWKYFIILIISLIFLNIFFFLFFLQDYQRNRIKILLESEPNSLSISYHIIQSKIAIGSGGLIGRGWMHGTQSQLNFLPERHTDFIFSVLAEDFGFLGILTFFLLYFFLILRVLIISKKIKIFFRKKIVMGLIINLFIYIFINIGMVTGILPVVGIPLPLFSYGGSSLLIFMIEFGIIMSMIGGSYKKISSDIS